MPGMGGRELVQQLSRSRPETKVLYLSGYTEDAIVSDGSIESGTAFLQKPFTLQNLSRKVREVLADHPCPGPFHRNHPRFLNPHAIGLSSCNFSSPPASYLMKNRSCHKSVRCLGYV